jgi:hypothetical protein
MYGGIGALMYRTISHVEAVADDASAFERINLTNTIRDYKSLRYLDDGLF